MSFFEKWEAAMGNKDLDALMELMHPEWTMVMHSSGKVINRDDYKEGYTLFAYNLTPTLCGGQYVDPEKSGDLAVELLFKAALTEAVTVCMYFEYNSMITINAARQETAHFNI